MFGDVSTKKCLEILLDHERDDLVQLQRTFDKEFDHSEYETLVKKLVKASVALYINGISSTIPDARKQTLSVKHDLLVLFLDKELPDWRHHMHRTLKNNITNILKLFLGQCQLDLSVFYLIDNTIDNPSIVVAYHDFINSHFLKSYTGGRIYNLYYSKKCKPIQSGSEITEEADEEKQRHRRNDVDRKRRMGALENELRRMRSFSDFIKSGKRMRIYQASSSQNMFIFSDDELRICVPPIESMMRGLGGIIQVDYRVNVFLASYLDTLQAFIPTFNDFELAKKEGMFEMSMVYHDFKRLCGNTYVQVDDYDEYLYTFVVHANKYFYQYFNAFWRDLVNKLMFEPVTFYLTLMATIFSICSLIQVLQNAKIIPPIN